MYIPRKIIATTIGPPMTHTPSLSIRDAQWHRIDCTVTPDLASVKYLGIHLDLRNTDTLFKRTFDDLATRTSHLLLQPGPPQAKVDYIRNKILPIARYTAMLANWPLARYRQLDRPLSAAYRRILALPKKFPSSLLYLSKQRCGIGLPRLSDSAQIMKWENFQRCLAVGGAPKKAVLRMINRLPNKSTRPGCNVRTIDINRWPSCWAYTVRSLVEWLAESGLHLACRITPSLPEVLSARCNKDALAQLAEKLAFWPSPPLST